MKDNGAKLERRERANFLIVQALQQNHSAKLPLKVIIYRGVELFISSCDNKGKDPLNFSIAYASDISQLRVKTIE